MRKAAVAAIAALALAGCGTEAGPDGTVPAGGNGDAPGKVSEFTVGLEDGRKLLCVYVDGGHDGGLSCDWRNASDE